MVKLYTIILSLLVVCFSNLPQSFGADRVRFAYPAKSLNYLPITMGRDKGMFQAEGIDLNDLNGLNGAKRLNGLNVFRGLDL